MRASKVKRRQKNISIMVEAIEKIKRLSEESSLSEGQVVEKAIARLRIEDLILDFSK